MSFVFTGATDVSNFIDMGNSMDGYINNVHLSLTNDTLMSPVYYVTVICKNGADMSSLTLSSRLLSYYNRNRSSALKFIVVMILIEVQPKTTLCSIGKPYV